MALTSTVFAFDVQLSDVDRGVYEGLHLKVAQHPSESLEYLVARVLAYSLEYEEGIAFSQGLAAADEPAVWIHDLTGTLRAWIEVGTPDGDRLHKASKAAERVVVYCHKDMDRYVASLAHHRVHAPERIALVGLDRALVNAVAARVERRTAIALSVTEGTLYVDVAGASHTGTLDRRAYPHTHGSGASG